MILMLLHLDLLQTLMNIADRVLGSQYPPFEDKNFFDSVHLKVPGDVLYRESKEDDYKLVIRTIQGCTLYSQLFTDRAN